MIEVSQMLTPLSQKRVSRTIERLETPDRAKVFRLIVDDGDELGGGLAQAIEL